MVCPTCTCFNVQDRTDLSGKRAVKKRSLRRVRPADALTSLHLVANPHTSLQGHGADLEKGKNEAACPRKLLNFGYQGLVCEPFHL